MPATGTGVGGGHQSDRGWKCRFQTGAAQSDRPLLQGLAQLIEHGPWEFRQLIEEQHAAVGEAQFPRSWVASAPQQGRRRAAVVRCPERALQLHMQWLLQLAGHGVDAGDGEGLIGAERG